MPSFTRATGPDGWLTAAADWGRLIWGAFYWNSAKTLFRLRGARGRAPCQHPSDSGRQGESFCEACVGLSNPRRFVRICPLIRYDDSPSGPRCSVAAAEVRPFWGRVFAALGLAGVGAGLLLAAVALIGFRWIGYRVEPGDLLWPPNWSRVRIARADYYTRRGFDAFSRGDAQGCFLALLEAHHLRPGDFATDRLLAQVAQASNPDFADGLYASLVRSPDPMRSANAAQEWGASLLARCDFRPLAELSAYMLRRGSLDSAPAWSNALIFTSRLLADPSVVQGLLAQPAALPEDCRTALDWSLQPGDGKLHAELLAAGRSSSSVFLRHYALSRLIREGLAREVLGLLESAAALPAREIEALRLSAWGELQWTEVRRREIDRLIGSGSVPPPLAELLAAQLIAYPDRSAGNAVLGAIERHPLPLTADNYGIYAALTCLAGVDQDAVRLKQLTATLGKISGRPFGRQSTVTELFLDRSASRPISPALVALQPLSLEVMFAMLADYPRLPRVPANQPQPQRAA